MRLKFPAAFPRLAVGTGPSAVEARPGILDDLAADRETRILRAVMGAFT